MKNLTSSFILFLALIILAVPLRSQDCTSQSQVIITDNDTTLLTLIVDNALNEILGVNGQGLCKVNIQFTHEYIGDLLVELIAPNGQTVILMGPPTTNSSSTDLVCWDICFVPNSFVAVPDSDFEEIWNNFNNWANLSKYTGSYYPFNGILEDFNGGNVNGTWTLRVNDISNLGEGVIESFELVFCDPTGLACFECSPNGGVISPVDIAYCEGDNNLIIPFDPDFGNDIPDPLVYDFLHIISTSDVVVEYTEALDMTSFDPGVYEVCGITILSDIVDDLPVIDGSFSIDSIKEQISLGLLCAQSTVGCYTVEIYNIPDTVFIQDTICQGESFQVGSQFFEEEKIHEITLFNGVCDSIVILNLEVIHIDAQAIASSMSISCSDDFLTLDGSNSVLDTDTSVLWTTTNGEIVSDPTQLIVQVSSAGTYVLTLTSSQTNGCVNSDTITVDDLLVLPQFDFSAGEINCDTPEAILRALFVDDDAAVEWSGPNLFSSDQIETTVDQGGIYQLIVTGTNGCIDSAEVEVLVDTITPYVEVHSEAVLKCALSQIVLDGSESDVGPFYAPLWSTFQGNIVEGENTYSPVISTSGMYYLQVEDVRNGCIGLDSILVQEVPNTIQELFVDIVEPLCFGYVNGSIHVLQIIGGDAPFTYSVNGNFYSTIQDFYLLASGEHIISVKDSSGCTLDTTIFIPYGKELDVSLGPDTLISLGETITITALLNIDVSEIESVRWTPETENDCIDCLEITVGPKETTRYDIRVTDKNGCVAEDFIIVRVKDKSPLYIPNIFSPNNDESNDDFLILGGIGVAQIDYINILDRWGNIVFEAFDFQPEDSRFSWDGNYRKEPLQPSVFSYIIGYTMINGVQQQEAGTITLMR